MLYFRGQEKIITGEEYAEEENTIEDVEGRESYDKPSAVEHEWVVVGELEDREDEDPRNELETSHLERCDSTNLEEVDTVGTYYQENNVMGFSNEGFTDDWDEEAEDQSPRAQDHWEEGAEDQSPRAQDHWEEEAEDQSPRAQDLTNNDDDANIRDSGESDVGEATPFEDNRESVEALSLEEVDEDNIGQSFDGEYSIQNQSQESANMTSNDNGNIIVENFDSYSPEDVNSDDNNTEEMEFSEQNLVDLNLAADCGQSSGPSKTIVSGEELNKLSGIDDDESSKEFVESNTKSDVQVSDGNNVISKDSNTNNGAHKEDFTS